MSTEIAALAALTPAHGGAATGAGPVQVGYGVSLSDIGGFQQALAQAGARLEARPAAATSDAARALMKPFEHINAEASRLAGDANAARQAGHDMAPSEVVLLTVR